ncbi:MAG: hypothetical protein ABIP94_18885, partial [Planctomycetota bacterium]
AVHALLALPDGDVLVGGTFAPTAAQSRLARWNQANGLLGPVGSGVVGPDVLAFAAAPNGDVFIGGDFDSLGATSTAAGNLAILTTNCPATVTPIPTGCVGPAGPLNLVVETLPWVGSTFRSRATGFAPSIAMSVLGFSSLNLPLSVVLPTGLPNCSLLATPDELIPALPFAGVSSYQFAIPDSPVLVGMALFHQFVQLEIGSAGQLLSLSSSNALGLVLGLF